MGCAYITWLVEYNQVDILPELCADILGDLEKTITQLIYFTDQQQEQHNIQSFSNRAIESLANRILLSMHFLTTAWKTHSVYLIKEDLKEKIRCILLTFQHNSIVQFHPLFQHPMYIDFLTRFKAILE